MTPLVGSGPAAAALGAAPDLARPGWRPGAGGGLVAGADWLGAGANPGGEPAQGLDWLAAALAPGAGGGLGAGADWLAAGAAGAAALGALAVAATVAGWTFLIYRLAVFARPFAAGAPALPGARRDRPWRRTWATLAAVAGHRQMARRPLVAVAH
ncbi:MAG: hypothetical protein LBD51_05885, partial [Bifidobacteriaceae bacterium]|nr:hypothetical protein [Bifidobacteriaceae bacterium]